MKLVIFAGGSGTRLWPISRNRTPKQAQPFGDNQTLLQKTFARLRRGYPVRDIWLSTSAEQYPLLKKQVPNIPRSQVILEPARRDTAAAIGLAAATITARVSPQETIATVWSDAYIKEPLVYLRALKDAGRVVTTHPNQTVLIGLKPRYPDTGLGYIKIARQVETVGKTDVFLVDRFVEKPDQRTAERYVRSWQYLWNPGMFVFRADAMLDKFRAWLPATHRILMKIADDLGTPRGNATVKRLYPRVEKISIDYAIMEKDRTMLAIPADFTWSDVGTWAAVHDMLADHPHHNVSRTRHISVDSRGNLLFSYSGKLMATAGVHDMIVIETDDAILVCPKSRAQDVKKIVLELRSPETPHHL